ncbi:hypothetical protein [Phenylobacterium sp.]|uniref:hypothetical protein n=1 Tax=Phenylobacterium sp. TaxID=1871053 RepID=UPI0025DB6A35|nr:hypothetical protein [Phenylobacterium sp.]
MFIDPGAPRLRPKDLARITAKEDARRHERQLAKDRYQHDEQMAAAKTARAVSLKDRDVVMRLIAAVAAVMIAWMALPVFAKSAPAANAFTIGVGGVLSTVLFGHRIKTAIELIRGKRQEAMRTPD